MVSIVDIRPKNLNNCKKDEYFWVDTQVLLWFLYYPTIPTKITLGARHYQLEFYPNFISELIDRECILITTVYNISELVTCIVRNEYKLFLEINKLKDEIGGLKKYRSDVENKKSLKRIISNVLLQLNAIVLIDDSNYNKEDIDNYVDTYEKHNLDFFDYILYKFAVKNQCFNIVTDDIDFLTVDGDVSAYTANRNFVEKS